MARTAVVPAPLMGAARLAVACRGASCCAWLPRRANGSPRTHSPVNATRSVRSRPLALPGARGAARCLGELRARVGGCLTAETNSPATALQWTDLPRHSLRGQRRQLSTFAVAVSVPVSASIVSRSRAIPPRGTKRARWSARDGSGAGVADRVLPHPPCSFSTRSAKRLDGRRGPGGGGFRSRSWRSRKPDLETQHRASGGCRRNLRARASIRRRSPPPPGPPSSHLWESANSSRD